jgi:hypothetical protein
MRISSISMRRGSILLEVLLSVALFVSAAALVNASVRQALGTVQRATLEAKGTDLARSVLSLLEAGALEINAVAGPVPEWTGSGYWSLPGDADSAGSGVGAVPNGWSIEVTTGASDSGLSTGLDTGLGGGGASGDTLRAGGLTLVTVTAVHDPDGDGERVTRVALSMLMSVGTAFDAGDVGGGSDLTDAAAEGLRLEPRR